MIKKQFSEDIDLDKYLAICEQLNQDPDPDKMPPEVSDYPLEVQQSFMLHSILTDRWDGASGMYMGKDFAPIGTYLETFDIEDKRTVVYFLAHIENENSNSINKRVKDSQKQAELSAKAKARAR